MARGRAAGVRHTRVTRPVAAPPRRPARGRHADQLIFHLALAGNAPLAPEYQLEILSMLAKKYYNTSGTVSAAQKAVAEDLNQYLLDRNLRNASSGHQAIGLFTQIVLRGERISIAQSGTSHIFLLASSGAQHLYDPQLAGRGLGGQPRGRSAVPADGDSAAPRRRSVPPGIWPPHPPVSQIMTPMANAAGVQGLSRKASASAWKKLRPL